MPATHFYPNPSDPCPIFMFGQFDLDDTDLGSSLALGEAMLSVQRKAGRDRIPASPSTCGPSGAAASRSRAVRSC